jgi:protein-S-isoprenylcysteine O-methyltransferase Ste14
MSIVDIISFLCVLFFLVLLVGRTLQMVIIHKINPFFIGANKQGFQKFIEILLLIGMTLWIYQSFIITLKVDIQILPCVVVKQLFQNNILQYIGLLLMVMGLLIFLFALISFGKSWRLGIDKDTPGKLITSGIFRYSRNPIFLFIDIYFIGFAFVYTSAFFIVFSIVTIMVIHYQILQEERFLLKQYNEEYEIYKKTVRRYL